MAGDSTPHSVGGAAPLPPEHSLPSYHEPTPETHGRMSREDEAELALTRTQGTRGTFWLITILFLLTIAALPAVNLAARLRREAHTHGRPGAEVLALFPTGAEIKQAHGWRGWVGLLPTAEEIKAAEKNLEKESIVTQYLLPRVQTFMTGQLGAGNEQVYPGHDGWLFYRPDVDYVIGPPFLDPARLKQRARDLGIQPDPVKAIVDFRDQLAARGITLIVVPVPAKPSVDLEMLAPPRPVPTRAPGANPLPASSTPASKLLNTSRPVAAWEEFDDPSSEPQDAWQWPGFPAMENRSFPSFVSRLIARGVRVVDLRATGLGQASGVLESRLAAAHDARRSRDPVPARQFLETDTHWRPDVMRLAAAEIADAIGDADNDLNFDPVPKDPQPLHKLVPIEVAALGDIAALLKLPIGQTMYRPQKVTIQQVQTGNGLWRPSTGSELLLLGDSFSNIFSLAAMGWGESAGLAEHLSYLLNRPLDCILRNSDGAFATREALSQELARGRDRLAGKKVVIWEFAERELMFGNWKMLSMALGEPKPAKFYSEVPAEGVSVTATVAATSFIPRPGTVPYKDHICSVHLEEIGGTGQPGNVQAVAYLWSMRENIWTAAARWRPGDRVKLRLTPWPGQHPERESFNRSAFTDPELSLEEPVWAEAE